MTLAGVDEAGYGPLLGPLVAGMAAFRADGSAAGDAVDRAVGEAAAASGVRVGDSKAIHSPARGPGALEETVLAFLAARDGRRPRDGRELMAALGAPPPPDDHPWYGGFAGRALPLAADGDRVDARAEALAAALAARGVRAAALRVRVLAEGRFNEAVAREGSKAAALFDLAADLLGRALEAGEGGPVEAICDRQGARSRYGPLLQRRFPGRWVRVVEEGRRASVYDLGEEGRPVRVRFEEKADGAAAAVGLASMAAKYVREAWMDSLNAWVLREAPRVRPTAGYWTDGVRFLRETGEARRRLGVDDRLFVRER